MKKISCNILFLILSVFAFGQNIEVQIKITPDNFPQDIRWEILDDDSNIIAEESLSDCVAFQECTVTRSLSAQECYTFIIRDAFGDGIESPGGYQVFSDGILVAEGFDFTDNAQHDFNCFIGESCLNAVELDLPTPPGKKVKAPKGKNYWFKLVPEEFGLYRISTCVNLISGQGFPDTELWIYESCDKDNVEDGPEGALAYSDNFIQCEPASSFYYFPLEGGNEYFIRHRRKQDQVDIDSIEIKIVKLPSIFGCTDSLSCNYNPYANIDNGSCVYDEGCGPDLRLDEEALATSLYVDTVNTNDECLVTEGCLRGPGPREVIRFSTKIDNIGTSDYILGSPNNNKANFTQNNCHGHWHHDGYAEYLLFDGTGIPEPIGFKTGFCVLDLECSGFEIPKYICSFMGISAGCSDIYDSEIECQWIDVTDTPDGTYTLVVRVNWNRFPDSRGFDELDYENNWGQVCFSIDRSSGTTLINILEQCEDYKDCQGNTFGQSEIDCEGICGGTAHYGDLDESGLLDYDDLGSYIDILQNGTQQMSSCFDLDDNTSFDIYDAALALECASANEDVLTGVFHNHCIFPRGFNNEQEFANVQIANHNEAEQYFDIELWAQVNDLVAFQIDIEGAEIASVEKLYTDFSEYFEYNSNSIFALHDRELITRNITYVPLVRIYYTDFSDPDICISPSSLLVNADFDLIQVEYDQRCILSLADEDEQFTKLNIYPNPVDQLLQIEFEANTLSHIDIMSISGKLVASKKVLGTSKIQFPTENLEDGIYLLRVVSLDGHAAVRKFVKASGTE